MEYLGCGMIGRGREQGIRDQLRAVAGQDRESDYPATEQVDDGGQIYPLATESDMGEVAGPDLIGPEREVGQEEVGESAFAVGRDISPFPTSFAVWLDAE